MKAFGFILLALFTCTVVSAQVNLSKNESKPSATAIEKVIPATPENAERATEQQFMADLVSHTEELQMTKDSLVQELKQLKADPNADPAKVKECNELFSLCEKMIQENKRIQSGRAARKEETRIVR